MRVFYSGLVPYMGSALTGAVKLWDPDALQRCCEPWFLRPALKHC